MSSMIKHQVVLYADGEMSNEEFQFFVPKDDVGLLSQADEEYVMTSAIFEEMGAPETITITVEPGDLLNS